MKKIVAVVLFFAAAFCCSAQNPRLIQKNEIFPTGNIWFYEFTPPQFNNSATYPLIISLHGGGEAGDSFAELGNVILSGIPKRVYNGENLEFNWKGTTQGFVMLAPQATRADVATWPERYVNEMINYGIANLRVDPSRIFVVGYSFGGFGTWNYATSSAANAAKLAGIVPAAPTFAGGNFCNIAQNKVAVWAFHGKGDNEYVTENAVNTINACSGLLVPAVDSVYPDGGHDIYNPRVYDVTNNTHYPNVYQWMLSVNRNLDPASNQNPVPVIAGPAVLNLTAPVNLRDLPVLDGTASFDQDDLIMDYLWAQTAGPSSLLPLSTANQWPSVRIPTGGQIGVPAGSYVFTLRVKDYLTSRPGHTQFATKTINVQMPASGHAGPATDAGADIVLSGSDLTVQVGGQAQAIYGGIVNGYNWTFVSGPQPPLLKTYDGSAPYSSGANYVMFANMDAPGTYVFEFSATTDLGDVGKDQIAITRLGALPVTYAYITATTTGTKNIISWATATEINSDRFVVMRSTDGVNFSAAGTIASTGGSVQTSYSFEDLHPPLGITYYRLSQVDKDGHASLSKIVSVNNRKSGIYIEKYPNPVHDNLSLTVQGSNMGKLQVTVTDMQGKTVLQQQWQKDLPLLKKVINVGGLQSGIYQVIITSTGEKLVSSFVKY